MKGLAYGHATLLYVQVSKCINVTDNGVKEIKSLKNLKTLLLFNLSGVNNLEECKKYIQSYLPNCKILGKCCVSYQIVTQQDDLLFYFVKFNILFQDMKKK